MLPLITLIALSVAQLAGAGQVRDSALDAQDALLHIKSVENFVVQIQVLHLLCYNYAVAVKNYFDNFFYFNKNTIPTEKTISIYVATV